VTHLFVGYHFLILLIKRVPTSCQAPQSDMILLILLEFIGGNFIVKALQYLHKERIVHRVVKATNILVGYIF
jgi:serine/threonine protein kinase